MPTEAYFYNYMSALDAGRYYRDFFDDFSMERYLRALEEERLDPKAKIRTMSSGMVAKVKLALTFARDSKLTMLDEPLNGIDIIARERTLALIRQHHTSERALIVSSHLVEELEEMIDDAVFMLNGAVALAGPGTAHPRTVRRRHRGDVPAHLWGRRCGRSCLNWSNTNCAKTARRCWCCWR